MSLRLIRPVCVPVSQLLQATHRQQPVRHFFSNPLGESTPQILEASKTLPYASIDLYNMVADVESYPSFVPYCTKVEVTQWSKKDEHYNRSWPQEVKLSVGFGSGASETFVSRLYCIPPVPEKGRAGVGIVEAISGDVSGPSVNEKHIEHHKTSKQGLSTTDAARSSSPLKLLRTQWHISAFPFKPQPGEGSESAPETHERSDVSLKIEYQFNNKMYEIMSQAVSGSVAGKMMNAFERRAQELLGKK